MLHKWLGSGGRRKEMENLEFDKLTCGMWKNLPQKNVFPSHVLYSS